MKKKLLSVLIDHLIIISSGTGLYLSLIGNGEFMGNNTYLYYTIQSNFFALLISIIFLIFKLLKKEIPRYLVKIKYTCVIGITLTFLVFSFLLAPQFFGDNSIYLLSLNNLTVHLISPTLMLISFICFDKIKINKNTYLLGLAMPILYFIFIIILTSVNQLPLFGGINGGLQRFPYFFMNYETNGWFRIGDSLLWLGTGYWIIILAILMILISKFVLSLNCKSNKK